MNLSCTLHDPDPKLNLNHFCRSQEQAPRLPVASTPRSLTAECWLLPHNPVESGQSSGVCRWPFHALDAAQRCYARPAQSDSGDEQSQGRAPPPPPPRQGRPRAHSSPRSVRCGSAFMGRRRGSSAATVLVLWSGSGRWQLGWPAGRRGQRTGHAWGGWAGRQHIDASLAGRWHWQ